MTKEEIWKEILANPCYSRTVNRNRQEEKKNIENMKSGENNCPKIRNDI